MTQEQFYFYQVVNNLFEQNLNRLYQAKSQMSQLESNNKVISAEKLGAKQELIKLISKYSAINDLLKKKKEDVESSFIPELAEIKKEYEDILK
jgi:hypothetical protein